jgi:hypothetical protein
VNREFEAAAFVLLAPLIARRTNDLIDVDNDSIDFDTLIDRSGPWSTGEKMLVDVALDLWNGRGTTTLMDAIGKLDTPNYARVLEAMAIRRGPR